MRLTLILAVIAALAAGQKTDRGDVQLAGAIKKEVVDGDLKGAIEQYKKIIAANRANHAVAAKALVQMGQCYEKLGDAEARKAYDQVLKDYPDQKELAETARGRIAALGQSKPAAQPPTRLVWAGPKSYADSISGDGRFISYTDWDTGNLAEHDLVTNTDRYLTTGGSLVSGEKAFAYMSSISRDGSQIAYMSEDKTGRDELRIASLSGDPKPRRLFDDPGSFEWSPDGRSLALSFVDAAEKGKPYLTRTQQIALVSVQDGSLRVLKSGPEVAGAGPFSPDGKYLLYTRKNAGSGPSRINILSLDAKSDVPLLPDGIPATSPLWTPDGSRVVFSKRLSGQPGGQPEGLWSVRVANGKPAGEPEQLLADSGAVPIGFARDGSLFYGSPTQQTDIYVAGLDPASGTLAGEPKRVNERAGAGGRLAWLPDSATLSFWTNRNGKDALVVHSLATSEEREIMVHDVGVEKGYLGWFPDGSLMTQEAIGPNRVFSHVDSRTVRTLATWTVPNWPNFGFTSTAFARDLMTAYFPKKDEGVPCNGALFAVCTYAMIARDFKTGRDRELFRIEAASVSAPSVSPDGRELAFVCQRSGRRLMMAPISGGAPRELYSGMEAFIATAWTQDGGHVLAFRSGEEAIWSFPAGGGAPVKSSMHHTGAIQSPTVSPDGTHLAFVLKESKSGIWVMNAPFGK